MAGIRRGGHSSTRTEKKPLQRVFIQPLMIKSMQKYLKIFITINLSSNSQTQRDQWLDGGTLYAESTKQKNHIHTPNTNSIFWGLGHTYVKYNIYQESSPNDEAGDDEEKEVRENQFVGDDERGDV